MNGELLNTFIKSLAIVLCVSYSFFKILNHNEKVNIKAKILTTLICALLVYIQVMLKNHIPTFYRISLVFFALSLALGKIAKIKTMYSILISIISFSISYIANFIASAVVACIFLDIFNMYSSTHTYNVNHIVPVIFDAFLNIFLVFIFFKIKKFKHGFPFLKKYKDNEFFNILLLIISITIIFSYFIHSEFMHIKLEFLLSGFIFFAIIMIIILQRTFVLYHKQKLQLQALKDYEQDLAETKRKLETAIQEKDKIVKSNHEFYHRQEALNKKLDILLKQQATSMNTEFGEDYSNILNRLKVLSSEYEDKTSSIPILDKTNITEIDDMLIYMQSECIKNNIEFIVKIDCDVNHIIENFITKSQLETMLGDLIRNAIIAINHSSNSFKSIMVVFGIKDNTYELCVLDSGIAFEIDTLINLGIKPASTHLDDGGTGIGFITTFETINSCNASLIINEITNNNYTKSLEIKFDGRNEYFVISNRSHEIKEANISNRNINLI